MALESFLIPFLTVAAAELGDKTQLAVICLSSKTKQHLRLLLGIVAAFALTTLIAVVFGNLISTVIPLIYIKVAAGIVFIVFGILRLREGAEEKAVCDLKSPFVSAFTLIFVSELGDKTQVTAALFSTRFDPVMVFFGSLAALVVLSIAAIFAGQFIASRVKPRTISKAAGVLFIVLGLGFVFL